MRKSPRVPQRTVGQMGWSAFHQAHPKSYMLFADLADGVSQQSGFIVLRRLIDQASLSGRYAMMPEPGLYRVVFQNEADALKVADALSAAPTGREVGWAGQWAVAFTIEMQAGILKLLSPSPTRTASLRLNAKPKRPPTPQ
jgi:hypothetical protein